MYVGLAELSQGMIKSEAQRSRWIFYEVVRIEFLLPYRDIPEYRAHKQYIYPLEK